MTTFRLVVQPILIATILGLAVHNSIHIYSIPTPSMEPTLQVGDHIVVMPYGSDTPQRGDVIVFRSPADRDELFVKRIVATPGDLVQSHAGRLFVDGHAAAEPYLLTQASTGSIPPQLVPAECYFVLGDNRANSLDSRQWGVLPRALLVGRARFVLWSSAGTSMEPRANASPLWRSALHNSSLRAERLFKPIQ